MNTTNNLHVLVIKDLHSTNTQPARVKIISARFKQSVIIPYTNEPGESIPDVVSAVAWLQGKGFKIVGHGNGQGHNYVITETFKPLKEKHFTRP
jgi:hypothetical protein